MTENVPDDRALVEALADAVLTARFGDEPVRIVTRRVAREALGPALLPVVRAAQAAELRARALDLYRRSNKISLPLDAQAGWDQIGEMRERADELLRRAHKLDPNGDPR